jgi:tetratricopeptide (TPR) repeat protein
MAQTGHPAEAEAEYLQALTIRRELAGASPTETYARSDLAQSHHTLGVWLRQAGQPTAAAAESRAALAIRQELAGANPTITEFRIGLADSLLEAGCSFVRSGRPREALDDLARAESIWSALADANPSVPDYRNNLADCWIRTAAVLLGIGPVAEARARCERSVATREALVKDHPKALAFRKGLAESLLRRGQACQAERDPAGASADWMRAAAFFESVPHLDGESVLLDAGCHALLSSVAGLPAAAVPSDRRGAEADRAMGLLRQAVAWGLLDPDAYRRETALDPLRDRPDFRLLLIDLDFPAAPFALVR